MNRGGSRGLICASYENHAGSATRNAQTLGSRVLRAKVLPVFRRLDIECQDLLVAVHATQWHLNAAADVETSSIGYASFCRTEWQARVSNAAVTPRIVIASTREYCEITSVVRSWCAR